MLPKEFEFKGRLSAAMIAIQVALLLSGCGPSDDNDGFPKRIASTNRPPRSTPLTQEEVWKDSTQSAEAMFSKLGLSQTNFSFHEEPASGQANQSDSKRDAMPVSAEQAQALTAERSAWNKKTLGDSYEAHGEKSSKWNDPARESLALFAQLRSGSDRKTRANIPLDEALQNSLKQAFEAGCRDPLIRYLHLRYFGVTEGDAKSPGRFAQEQIEIADAMEQSDYPAIRKFYGRLRALNSLARFANPTQGGRSARIKCMEYIEQCLGHLRDALEDPTTPRSEAFEATEEFLGALLGPEAIRGAHFAVVHDLLLKHHAKSGLADYFKGDFYIGLAWAARGNGYADSVTPEGWKAYSRRLEVACTALNQAWEQNPSDPNIARKMMTVELGQGGGRPRMERWFRRTMTLDNSNYSAASSKLNYLEPKWYGSEEDVLAFGRECLLSDVWRGEIPYLTVYAHERVADYHAQRKDYNYWKQSSVWNECQQAFEKLFQMDIHAEGYHHNYALIAYRCGQWEVFDREIKLMTYTNFTYFGGRAEFSSMVSNSLVHLGKK